uniref:NADH dehydrogenase subunit 5 n=1 Tax=Ammopiptanthus mongolicus TaxID=126911 RepID=A0A385G2A1_AMMMO|nr:NADH dehydrogenase subunit 5 [Ammopiptanthus mongolicus]AXV54323.1 NADH dehydrogenase subunit 5 [Ammopiptanthus mongolicus]
MAALKETATAGSIESGDFRWKEIDRDCRIRIDRLALRLQQAPLYRSPTHSLARLERHEQTKEGGIAIFFPSTQVSVRVEFRGASAHTKRSYMANSSLGGSSSPISLPWLRVTLIADLLPAAKSKFRRLGLVALVKDRIARVTGLPRQTKKQGNESLPSRPDRQRAASFEPTVLPPLLLYLAASRSPKHTSFVERGPVFAYSYIVRGLVATHILSGLASIHPSLVLPSSSHGECPDRRAGIASKFVERGAGDSRSAENQVIGLYLSMVGAFPLVAVSVPNPISVAEVPLVPDSVKPSGSDKEEGGKEARDSRLSGSGRMKFIFSLIPAVSLALTPMNQIVPYVPPQPSDPLMEKISRLERADLDLSADDDVHSWLDALNERELSRLRKNFLRASVAYNVNPVADQFQRAFQTSTFCNRLYSFFNKRWFFDQVLNDFLVRSFLRFGYEVSFEALDKGAIEILGPYGISYTFRRLAERISQLQSGFVVRRVRYDPWPPAWSGGGGSSVVGKRETRLYEPEERLQSSSRGVQTGAFCSASRNASE